MIYVNSQGYKNRLIILSSALIFSDGKLLLLKRSETSKFAGGSWQLPEGKLEEGELPAQGMAREIQEELSLAVVPSNLVKIHHSFNENGGVTYTIVRLIYKLDLPAGGQIKLSEEHTEYGFYSKEEVNSLPIIPGLETLIKDFPFSHAL